MDSETEECKTQDGQLAIVMLRLCMPLCSLSSAPPVVAAAEYAARDCGACAGTEQQEWMESLRSGKYILLPVRSKEGSRK